MLPVYLLSASTLTAMSLGALLYAVAGQAERKVEGAAPEASVEGRPEQLSARYREQMTLVQETLRGFGYTPGRIGGTIGFETRSALRAFQQQHGLRVTGRANPETLAVLGIEDQLPRRPQ
jgi:peptidoglycan hydrolase-like protein with peptidoglycan-binding domain